MGNVHWFQVTSLKPSITHSDGYHDSLLNDMSNMSLDADCSTDSIVVDGEGTHEAAQIVGCSAACNFFMVTLHSRITIQTSSSDAVIL